MQRTLEIIDRHIASLTETASMFEAQPGAHAPALAAVHHFAAATLADVRKQIVEGGEAE